MNMSDDNALAVSSKDSTLSNEPRFNREEQMCLVELFRSGSYSSHKDKPTRFKMLEKFIFSYRNSGVNPDDPLLSFWLLQVAPSCVYPVMEAGRPRYYQCCFKKCKAAISSQFAMIRHYKEQHYYEIPAGIFGEIVLYPCKPCKVMYKRLDHLKSHQASNSHKSIMARLGDQQCKEDLDALNAAKRRYIEERNERFQNACLEEASRWTAITQAEQQDIQPGTSKSLTESDHNNNKPCMPIITFDDDDEDDDILLLEAMKSYEESQN